MASYFDQRLVRERNTRTLVFRVSAIVVAFAALGLATGWHFYGNLIAPHPTVAADPSQKIGPADGHSVNPATLDNLNKPAGPTNK